LFIADAEGKCLRVIIWRLPQPKEAKKRDFPRQFWRSILRRCKFRRGPIQLYWHTNLLAHANDSPQVSTDVIALEFSRIKTGNRAKAGWCRGRIDRSLIFIRLNATESVMISSQTYSTRLQQIHQSYIK
jgi:hypothetical protein